jgi:hypothetical protein
VVVHAYNPSTQEVEAGGSAILDQRGIQKRAKSWWLTPVILVSQEAEIRRIKV